MRGRDLAPALQASISLIQETKRQEADRDLQEWLDATPVPPKRLRRKKMNQAIERVEPQQMVRASGDGLQDFLAMREQAKVLVQSGFLPKAVNTPEKAMAIIQTGRELGLGPMQSLRSIHIIEGKPTMSADLIAGLALAKVPGSVLRVAETTNEKCVVEAGRAGQKVTPFTFTMKDAQQAGLAGKSNWKNYPRAMLRARAITEAARAIFPDAVMGLYDPDELGAVTNEAGQVVAEVTNIAPHITPGEDPNAEQDYELAAELQRILEAIKTDCASCDSYDKAIALRAMLGTTGQQSELTKRIQAARESDAINASTHRELGKLWQHCHRQVAKLEKQLAPGPEASFGDEEDEREPGEEG